MLLSCVLACLALLLACGLGVGLVQAGVADPPEFTLSAGPLAISGGRGYVRTCPQPYEPCRVVQEALNKEVFYAIWLVYPIRMQTSHYGHVSIHLPMKLRPYK